MRRILTYAAKYPWAIFFIILTVSTGFYTQLSALEIQVSTTDLLVRNDPASEFSKKMDETFGRNNITLIYLENENPLSPKRLLHLKDVINELKQLDFVERIDSLFNIPYIRTIDGYLDKEAYLKVLPESDEESEQILTAALKNPFLKYTLLSDDKKTIGLSVTLKETTTHDNAQQIVQDIDDIITPLKVSYQKVFQVGYPYARTETTKRIIDGQLTLLPLAFVALFVALLLLLRNFIDLVTPLLTAGLSILWTFGFMSLMHIPISVITSIIPILLIVVGSTEDIHLMSEFRAAIKEKMNKATALKHMNKKMGRAVFLTFLTSYAGFLSVGASDIAILLDFAIVASTGLLFNFLLTILLVPAILSIAGCWGENKGELNKDPVVHWITPFPDWLEKNRWAAGFSMLAIFIFFSAGITSIKVNNNLLDNFNDDSEIHKRFNLIDEKFSGLDSFSIVIDSGIEDTFLKIRYLEQIKNIQDFIINTEISRSSTSFADYLTLLNTAFQELETSQMPESDDVINELMIFLSHDDVKSYITPDFSLTRIVVRHGNLPNVEIKAFLERLQHYFDTELDKGLTATITGDTVLNLSATDAIINGQLQSIIFMLLTIILIISLLFTDIKVGLIAAIPNFFPVVIMFGFMGFSGIPLNIGTAMAAAIAIGIAVDDTLHFMLRYNRELNILKHQGQAMHNTIIGEARPVLATSLALIAGFMVFSQSDFAQIRDFGLLSAIAIASALVADFIITPLLLSSLHLVTLWDLLSLRVRKEVLYSSIIFKDMHQWQIKRFILSSNVLHYFPDAYIFKTEEESQDIFVIIEGKVKICLPTKEESDAEPLEILGAGEVFGEISMLANEKRLTDAIAMEQVTLLILTKKGLKQATRFHPKLSAHLFLNLATSVSKRIVAQRRAAEVKNIIKQEPQS